MPGDVPGPYLPPIATVKRKRLSNIKISPDILHSSLGLAALATMHDPDLKSIDPALCISISARENFERSFGSEDASGNFHNSNNYS